MSMNRGSSMQSSSMRNELSDPATFTFDFWTPKQYHFSGIPRSFPIPSLNTLGSFVFQLCSGQTDKQADKQTDGLEHPTHTDRHHELGRVDMKSVGEDLTIHGPTKG